MTIKLKYIFGSRMTLIILLFLFAHAHIILAQKPLNKEFFKSRREAFRKLLPKNTYAVFLAAEMKNRSNDVFYRYHQDPDFYYLTGYNEPDAVLVIYKDSIEFEGSKTNELLFVRPRNPKDELWNGPRLGIEGTQNILGFSSAVKNTVLFDTAKNNSLLNNIRYNIGMLGSDLDGRRSSIYEFTPTLYNQEPNSSLLKDKSAQVSDIMNTLRETKTPHEIALLRKAIEISCTGQIATMKALKPGMTEMEAQGVHEFVYKKNGCQEVGYPSIVGAGNNGCVLHYIKNDKILEAGELLLMDVGAEYEKYTADVTRTIPVNGKFSREQKIIYNIVKEAQEAGFNECKTGNSFRDPHMAAKKIISKKLMDLNIIQNESEVTKYFPHGSSHYLGLDVHDRGTFGKFKPNTIITVEPGIYIPEGSPCDKKWWGIGIRIEDDILITEKGWENLSRFAPRSIEEIEKLMSESSPLDNFDPKINK